MRLIFMKSSQSTCYKRLEFYSHMQLYFAAHGEDKTLRGFWIPMVPQQKLRNDQRDRPLKKEKTEFEKEDAINLVDV